MASTNPFDPVLFRPEAVSPEVRAFNEAFMARAATSTSSSAISGMASSATTAWSWAAYCNAFMVDSLACSWS